MTTKHPDDFEREDALAALRFIAYRLQTPSYDKADVSIDTLKREILTANTGTPCPHVRTSAEGTSYCTLAEAGSGLPEGARHELSE